MLKHKRFLIIYSIALIIRLGFAVPFVHDWDGFVFSESAKNFLKGETPYMTVLKNDPSIYPDSDKPMSQQWYAYPPLPLLMFTAPLVIPTVLDVPLSPVAQMLLLKSPFIVGDLLAAWLIKKFLENENLKLAKRAEVLILFNPLFIWVSSAWGMFDIWMANFLLLFLLSLRKSGFWQAGIFLALACTTKLFPVFFLPVIGVYIFKTIKNHGQRWRLFLGFLITLTLIIVPFFVTSPRGFLNQNLLMHLQRSTQGVSIPALFDYYRNFYQLPEIPLTMISGVLMYLSIFVVFLLALAKIKNEGSLIWAMVVTYIPILLFNKVTNEQYFVLLIVLSIALLSSSTGFHFSRKLFFLVKNMATYGALIAASLLGFHFLGFLLPEITHQQLGTSTNHLVFYLSRHFNLSLYAYPDSPWTFYNILATLASFAILPFILLGLTVVFGIWWQAWKLKKKIGLEILSVIKLSLSIFKNVKIAFALLATLGLIIGVTLFLSPVVKAYIIENELLTPVRLIDEKDLQPLPENPKVGTIYNVWWNNFSHYKDFPYGDWQKTSLKPQAGFYTSKNSYYVQHIKQMKEAKIDFTLVSYHLYDRKRYLTFGYYAEKLGLYYAPLIEPEDILAYDEFRPTSPDGRKVPRYSPNKQSKEILTKTIISSLADNINSPAMLQIENKPAVFVYDGHWFHPSWDEDFKLALASRIVSWYPADQGNVFDYLSESWEENINSIDDIVVVYPSSVEEFNGDSPKEIDFRQAFFEEYGEFWRQIKEDVERKVNRQIWLGSTFTDLDPYPTKSFVIQTDDLFKTNAFDGEFFYSLANTWVAWRFTAEPETIKQVWEQQVEMQADRNGESDKPLFLTTTANYNDKYARPLLWFEIPREIDGVNTYDWTWETALQYNPDYVLITSWNEFFEGTAIEPTEEYGDYYIRQTAEWVEKFRQQVSEKKSEK